MTKVFIVLCLALLSFTATAQPNQVYSHGDPTPEEQLMLEMINRARANPTEEGVRLMDTDDARVQQSYSFFNINKSATKQAFAGYAQRPPLAFHPSLMTAAADHSKDMDDHNFQGHNSSNGDDLGDRYAKVGYASMGTYGENVAAYSESVWHGHCGLNVDWGTQNQIDLGHRTNIMNISNYLFTEIGIGIIINNQGLQTNHVGPYVITQDFGLRSVRYITGVVYNDKNANGFYDIGEGLSGVSVKPDRGTYYAVTSTSGGYAIPFTGSGSVVVTASEGGLAAPVVKTVDFSGENIKVDFIPASQGPGNVTLRLPANNATGRPLEVTLEWNTAPMADSYEYQVATTQNFSANTIVAKGKPSTTSALVTVPQCNTKYYWRVRGVNSVGNGQWSAPYSFTTGGKLPTSTTASSPKGAQTGDNTGTIAFAWTSAADATTYHLRIKNSTSPFAVIYEDTSIVGTTKNIPVASIGAGSFTWEVRAKNSCGNGGWSTPAGFSLTVTSVAESMENGWGVKITPHPVTSSSTVVMTAPIPSVVTLTLSDLSGSSHVLGSYNVESGQTTLPVDVRSQYASGMYLLTISSNGTIVSRVTLVIP
ncbi:MAG: T9SS type A sorting domain-containing protein [Ignavibacteria bacterium]|nr:T9SS type A sorting domain-containing protein [Ignavibacteria bacterium]